MKQTITLPTLTLVRWLKWLNEAPIEIDASGPLEAVATEMALLLNEAGFDTSTDPASWPPQG